MAVRGRPKHRRPHEVTLSLAKHPLMYRTKRLYWVLLEYEKKMSKDITSVKLADYDLVLKSYTECVELLKKQGIKYKYNVAKGRVDKPKVVQDSDQDGTTKDSRNKSVGLGAGISAPDPFA